MYWQVLRGLPWPLPGCVAAGGREFASPTGAKDQQQRDQRHGKGLQPVGSSPGTLCRREWEVGVPFFTARPPAPAVLSSTQTSVRQPVKAATLFHGQPFGRTMPGKCTQSQTGGPKGPYAQGCLGTCVHVCPGTRPAGLLNSGIW